ncbi:transmembrane protease serine 5-like isoform X1 [Carcharodon carcharias]|uniref:transmembrane protease serine 5-like isoform X1 n=1 Tax=Carcharodon carcharias TaxID=13397 RepID=UPI001B7E5B88|nr:transmembrane protease serine 5-like isoform X1 [Carcharodon carcharias]
MKPAEPQGEIIPLMESTLSEASPAQFSEDPTLSSEGTEPQGFGVPFLAVTRLEASPQLCSENPTLGSGLILEDSKDDPSLTVKLSEPQEQGVPLLEAPTSEVSTSLPSEGPSESVRRKRWRKRFRPRRRPPRAAKRILVLLCAVTIFSAIVVAMYFIVRHLERPIENKTLIPIGGNGPTTDCNETDTYVNHTASSTVSFRINTENSLLEIRHQAWQVWLPVCDEKWNSSLGKRICRYMGHIKYLNSSVMNISEIGSNYTQGFVELTDGQDNDLEKIWSYRASCASGKVIKLKCSACGEKHDFFMIVGGQEAKMGSWPWQVTLYYQYKHMCGGSIIDRYWVLTAAHCVHRSPFAYNWLVYAGILDRQVILFSSVTSYVVEKIIYNSNYDDETHDYDIALLKLKKPIEFSNTVRAVCLPEYNQHVTPGKECWISGWGHVRADAYELENILKEASVPLISTERCNSSCMYNGAVSPRMLCAGYKEGKVDACQGDSGGPLVCEDVQAWHLTGVVSWGVGCAEANHPGVYTKVSEFLDWIYSTIERLDTSAS